MINPFLTIWVNFRYLSFSQAIHLPILLHFNSRFKVHKGGRLKMPSKFGILRIGSNGAKFVDPIYERTLFKVMGICEIQSPTFVGVGSRVLVHDNGTLRLGGGKISARSTILCNKLIEIEEGFLCSWDCCIMDLDYHRIYDANDKDRTRINPATPVHIGKNVWVGCRSLILKGATIPANSVIAAGSTITGNYTQENCIYGDFGKVIKTDIMWSEI